MALNKLVTPTGLVRTHQGGAAFKQDDAISLLLTLACTSLKGDYYRTQNTQLRDIISAAQKVDPVFAAKAAIYIRRRHGNRTTAALAGAWAAIRLKGTPSPRRIYRQLIVRPDDILELAAASRYLGYNKPPRALLRAATDALLSFDEYQLAKYQRKQGAYSLRDIVRLAHTPLTPAIKAMMDGTLKNTNTWEAQLSAGKDKADTFKELLVTNRLGGLALLRNLRNIIQTQDQHLIAIAAEQIPQAAIKARLWPHQLYQAFMMVKKEAFSQPIINALNEAIEASTKNLKEYFSGECCVVIDESGSMSAPAPHTSHVTMFRLAAVIGIAAAKATDADVILFSNDARFYKPTHEPVTEQVAKLSAYGGGTAFCSALCLAEHKHYDRIIVFSDMQLGDDIRKCPTKYDATIVAFNLYGGNASVAENKLFQLGGFNPELLKLTSDDIINEINRIEI